MFFKKSFVILLFNLISLSLFAGTYYIDPAKGDDNLGSGTSSAPWRTITKGLSVAFSNDTIILKDGFYGELSITSTPAISRSNWIVIKAENEHSAVLSRIYIKHTGSSYLLFDGLHIKSEWRDPDGGNAGASDPQYPDSTYNTYAKAKTVVVLDSIQNLKLINCLLEGTLKYLTPYAFTTKDTQNITLERSILRKTNTPVSIGKNSVNTKIIGNLMDEMSSSAIRVESNCTNTLIEMNNVFNSNWEKSEDYCPRLAGYTYHGSAVALRSGDVTIKKNIFHDGFNSSGIMFYTDYGPSAFSNITIENNLMYDIHNTFILRMYLAGDNILIRNNTFVGSYRIPYSDTGYKYNSGISLHSLADGYDGSGIQIYNNVIVGISSIGEIPGTKVKEGNNIYWSLAHSFQFFDENDFTTTSDVVYDNLSFFVNDFFVETKLDFEPYHTKHFDFRLSPQSQAINFGDATNQPSDSLGSIHASGFIIDDGPLRDSGHSSAGCYEMGSSGFRNLKPEGIRISN